MLWIGLIVLASVIGGFVYLNDKLNKLNALNEARLKELEAELSRRIGKVMNSHIENVHKMNLFEVWRMEGESGRHDLDSDAG